MHTQKQKSWIKRIILLITFSLVFVVSAPQIVNYTEAQNNEDSYTAHAVAPEAKSASAAKTEKTMERIDALMELQTFFHKLLWPVLYMIGGLMDNSLLFGGGMGAKLRSIWVPIRNIVNIFFVIALVGIALYNILGIGEDGGATAIKTALPKIIVGIIAVNFSFLGIKVALDAVNIVTTAIFALPNEIGDGVIFKENDPKSKAIQEGICLSLAETTKSEAEGPPPFGNDKLDAMAKDSAFKRIAQKYGVKFAPAANAAAIVAKGATLPEPANATFKKETDEYKAICKGRVLSADGKIYFEKFKSNNAAFAMATNMINMTSMPSVDLTSIKDFNQIGTLAVNALFGVIMYILFAASFVALLLVLLARIVVMWISIVVSPLLVVAMAVPSLKEQLGAVGKLSEQFVKHLIVPIPIALSLSVGWIMLKAIQNQNFSSLVAQGTDVTLGIPVVGMSTLPELITAIGCAAVVWMGVFSSAEGTLAEGMTGWIKEKLKAGGEFLGAAPFKYLPLIPIGGKNYSLGAFKTFADELQNKTTARDTSLVNSDLGKMFHLGESTTTDDLKKERDPKKYVAGIKSDAIMNQIKAGTLKPEDLVINEELRRAMAKEPEKYGALQKAIETYGKAGDDTDARKKAGKAIYEASRTGALKSIDGATPKTADATPATDGEPAVPGKKGAPAAPIPTKEDQGLVEFEIEDKKYVTNADGTKLGTWDEEKGFKQDTSIYYTTDDNRAIIAAAQAKAAESEPIRQAGLRAGERGFGDGLLQTKKKAGTLSADEDGTISLSLSETEVYTVDPETGGLKKITPAQFKARKRVVQLGSVKDDGTVTITSPLPGSAAAQTSATQLQEAPGVTPPTG